MARLINPGMFNNINIDTSKLSGEGAQVKEDLQKESPLRSFKEVLQEKEGVNFSSHAQKRIQSRNIDISEADMDKLKTGIDKIREKGGKDSVVLMDDRAFVVSARNNTVVTVMEGKDMKENVFTNIDSMIIM